MTQGKKHKSEAETIVSEFYNKGGWDENSGDTTDALLWEDLRPHAAHYVHQCRMRVLDHIPAAGDTMLDLGSGPIQYPEYLEFSRNFKKRYCVDLSEDALAKAKEKIHDHGEFFAGSFFDIDFEENFFDCSICLHTIYHIDRSEQEPAIRKLLNITKPNRPVIVVYSNHRNLIRLLSFPIRMLARGIRWGVELLGKQPSTRIYGFSHPPSWWKRFEDVADVKFYPWRSFASEHQKILFPDNRLGAEMFNLLFRLEERWPHFFSHWFQYPIIILTKRGEQT